MMILFWILLLAVFARLLGLAIRLAWGAFKICFFLVLMPGMLIALACGGMLMIALPVLALIGAGSLLGIEG